MPEDLPSQSQSDDVALPLEHVSMDEEVVNHLREPLLNNNQDAEQNQESSVQPQPPSFRSLLFYRSIYFLNGLSSSTWGRFGIVYYNRIKHLNPGQIGVLQGVSPVLRIITQPFWGYVADFFQSRKKVYVVCKGCSTLLLLSLSLKIVNSFWSILLCVAGMSCFSSGGVLDAHTLDFLGEAHRGMYGSIRLWTAVSWGLGAVVMGGITDHYGFQVNFSLFGGMMSMNLLAIIFGLPERSKSEQEIYDRINHPQAPPEGEAELASPQIHVLANTILRLPVLLWLSEVAIIGSGMVIVDSFLFVFLQNELKASTELCGYTVGVTVLLELPIFHFSDFLLKRLGHDVLFLMSMLAYSIRVIGYTFLTPSTVYWVLLLEVTHGITFACMWISSIDYAASVAPKEWSTTVQSLLSTSLTCVGGGLGPVIGGLVMDRHGPYVMFRGIGLIVAGVLLVHSLVFVVFHKGHDKFLEELQSERQPQEQSGDEGEVTETLES